MVRRHVLAALAAGIAAGDEDAARAALSRIDWILRGAARRRLELALVEAALVAGDLNANDLEASRHVQRIAALAVTGSPATDPTDRIAVAAAQAALAVPRV